MGPLPPSPETTLAVILGASKFPKQPQLTDSEAFLNSARGVRKYLLDSSGLGIAPDNLLDLFDSDDAASDMDEKVVKFLSERQQQLLEQNLKARDLLVYYVGHGGFSKPGNEYFLAIRKTRNGNEGHSSYLIKALANTLRENATHLRRYLVLDSCFAAAAFASFQSAPLEVAKQQTIEELPPKGTALLCASGPKDPAKTLPTQSLTMFSESFLEALRLGDPENPGSLSFLDVSEITRNLIKEKFPDLAVRPEMHSPDQKYGNVATTPFFPNAAKYVSKQIQTYYVPVTVAWPVADATYVWPLADRTDEFELFENMITGQSKSRILLLCGPSNTGKTACISELAAYTQRLGVSNAFLDLKGTPSLEDLFAMLRLDLGPEILARAITAAPSARFVELISDLQQPRVPVVLFFDTYQQASAESQQWLENRFLPRIDRAPGVITVIGGQTVPAHRNYTWKSMTEVRILKPITEVDDWLKFIGRKWPKTDVPVEYVKGITLAAKGEPGMMSALLETMMLGLDEESGD